MTFTTPALLDLEVPVRSDAFDFRVYDAQHNDIGTVEVSETAQPTISVNTQNTAVRSCSGLTIVAADLSELDPLRQRIAPFLVLQNGERFPLGVLMFGQDNRAPFSWGVKATPELSDESFLVDQPLDATMSLPQGGSVVDMVTVLLGPVGLPAVVIEAGDQAASSSLVWRVGTSRMSALQACAGLLGCFNPFFDNAGAFRFKLPPAPGSSTDHQYPWGSRVIDDTTVTASTAYKIPNRFVVIGDNADTPIVGVYDLPDSAPHSAAHNGGRIVTTTRNMQGLTDQSAANAAAYLDALTYNTPYETIDFAATADPRHDVYDSMTVRGVDYLETGWSLDCANGGEHHHTGARLWE